MNLTSFVYDWDYWELRSKVTFDGINKLIYVNEGVSSLNIREDLYKSWVNWLTLQQNTKFLPAMRYTGLDPIPGGYTGATFFLINGWKLVYDPRLVGIDGVLYSDDYDTPYYFTDGKPIYPATVSALVNQVTTVQNVVTGDLGSINVPTAAEIANQVNAPSLAAIVAAVIEELYSNNIPVNMTHVRGQALTGTGTADNPWGPA